MFFGKMHHLAKENSRLYRKAYIGAQNHCFLSAVWLSSILAKKEIAFFTLVFGLSLFWEVFNEQAMAVILLLLCFSLFALPLRRSMQAFFATQILSACLAVGWRDDYLPAIQLSLDSNVLRALLLGVAVLCFVARYRIDHKAFGVIAIGNAIYSLGMLAFFGASFGLSTTVSLNAAFTATFLPFVPPLFLPIVLASIFLQPGALAYGIVGIHFALYTVGHRRIWLGPLLAVFAFIGWNYAAIPCAGRAQMYGLAFGFFLTTNVWIGSGLGSFGALGNVIQKLNHFMPGEYWYALHSDWLQVLFESGFLGVVTLYWAFLDALWVARRDLQRLSTLTAIAACAAFYHPFHIPIFALCYAVFILQPSSRTARDH